MHTWYWRHIKYKIIESRLSIFTVVCNKRRTFLDLVKKRFNPLWKSMMTISNCDINWGTWRGWSLTLYSPCEILTKRPSVRRTPVYLFDVGSNNHIPQIVFPFAWAHFSFHRSFFISLKSVGDLKSDGLRTGKYAIPPKLL